MEYESGSFMYDDPANGFGAACTCWMLSPGETCERASQSFGRTITSRPPSCPPL